MYRIVLITLLVLLGGKAQLNGQDHFVVLDSIVVEGNKKTKRSVILREILIKEGDTIELEAFQETIDYIERRVMNTALFTQVKANIRSFSNQDQNATLVIKVEETWYIYPIPVFELADRNFNVWWVDQKRSLDRINYGMDFLHTNFSGHMDRVKASFKTGYTRRFALRYSKPYIDKRKKLGFETGVAYSLNREVNYGISGNRQQFYKNEEQFVLKRLEMQLSAIWRPQILSFHQLQLRYQDYSVTDTVAKVLNPDYFLEGKTRQRYFSLSYIYSYDDRDVRPYPIKGNLIELILKKDGLGIWGDRNSLIFTSYINHYISLNDRSSLALTSKFKWSLIRELQPDYDNRAIGYGNDYLRGYEFYVVDGRDMVFLKSSLRRNIFNSSVYFGRISPIKAFRTMPVKVFAALNGDVGYVGDRDNDEVNFLNGRLLTGVGVGLDCVLFFDKVFQIEYSFNHLKESGLFLHLNLGL